MSVVAIDRDLFVNPDDVCSIEDHDYWSSRSPSNSFLEDQGSRIILKNGQKLYIRSKRAIEVYDMLFPPLANVVPSPESPRHIMIMDKQKDSK